MSSGTMVANEGLEKAENTPTHFGGRVEWTPRRESKHPVEWWAMPAVIRIIDNIAILSMSG